MKNGAGAGSSGWLDQRMGLSGLLEVAKKKEVPVHEQTLWYYFGGMTLFLFLVQVITGILLLLYYRPSSGEAYESVHFLMAGVPFGWLVRSIHAWAASLVVLTAWIHFFSTFLLKAYRPRREVIWFSGVVLLALVLAFGFTGYLLPWNERSYFATRVGTQITGSVPWVGPLVRHVLLGGDQVTGATLTRFFGFHVAFLPAVTTLLLSVHLYLVQWHGMSVPMGVSRRGRVPRVMPFFPDFLLRDLVGWLSALALLAALAAYYPAELGRKADPFAAAPAGIKPEWYFLAMFQTLKILPSHVLGIEGEVVGIVLFGLVGLFVLLVPLLDRTAARGTTGGPFTGIGITMLVYMVALTALGFMAE